MIRDLSQSDGLLRRTTLVFFLRPISMALKNGFGLKTLMKKTRSNDVVGYSTSPILIQICCKLNELSSRLLQYQKRFYVNYCKNGTKSLQLSSEIQTLRLHQQENVLRYSNVQKRPKTSPYSPQEYSLSLPYPKHLQSSPCSPSLLKLRPIRTQGFQIRSLHDSSILLDKSKSNSGKDCKSMNEICKIKVEHCGNVNYRKDKDSECIEEKVKCQPVKHVKEKTEEKERCPTSCVREGKCIIVEHKKPDKMVYGSVECPPPKLIKPRTCPTKIESKQDESVCTGKRIVSKPKKEICPPIPLPGPPTEPVSLCPCPPPPKIHPGPCPCSIKGEEITIKPSPPCPIKDKYPCCLPSYYCPPKKPCKKEPPCDQNNETKS